MEKGCNKRVDILTRCIIRRVHFKWGYMKKLRITGRERWNSLCLRYPLESTLCGPQGWIHTQLVCTACTYSHISHPAHTHTDTHTHTQQLDGCWSVLPESIPASHALLSLTHTHTHTHTHTAVGWLLVCTALMYSCISCPAPPNQGYSVLSFNTERSVMNL